MREICTGRVTPEGKFYYTPTDPDCMALLLSRCRRSEQLQTMVEGAKDLLEEYFATDYAGILLYRSTTTCFLRRWGSPSTGSRSDTMHRWT